MTDARSVIPKWPSLGPVSVFRNGPWEAIVVAWLAGACALAIWLFTPSLRIATVLDPFVATAIGAALLATIAVRVGAKLWATLEFGWPYFAAATLLGGGLGYAASRTLFAPVLSRASACAPFFPLAQSTGGRVASWLVPVAMWIAWCLYLTARIPVIEQREHLLPTGKESRYRPYSHALRRLLPFRLAITAAVCAAVVTWVFYKTPAIETETNPDRLAAALRDPFTGTLDRERGGEAFGRLAAAREQSESTALAALAALDFDGAGEQVRRSGCAWLAPGDQADPRIGPAVEGFTQLDQQIEAFREYAWEPSPSTAAAIVKLLPLGGQTEMAALFPGDWGASPPAAAAKLRRSSQSEIEYKGEVVLVLRRTTMGNESQQKLVEVGLQLLGRAAHDTALPQEVSRRLGKPPAAGPCPVRDGAYCTVWEVGERRVRLGPDDTAESGTISPMWLFLYDPRFTPDCCA
jgi:hypothetical protein